MFMWGGRPRPPPLTLAFDFRCPRTCDVFDCKDHKQKSSSKTADGGARPTWRFAFLLLGGQAGGGALLQGKHDYAQHVVPGGGLARPDFELARGLVDEHLDPWNHFY